MSLPMRGGMLRYHSRADLRNRLPECVAGHSSNTLKTYRSRSEEHTSELQSRLHLVCRLLLEKKKIFRYTPKITRLVSRPVKDSEVVSFTSHAPAGNPQVIAEAQEAVRQTSRCHAAMECHRSH